MILKIGDKAELQKTISDSMVKQYAELTGDNNLLHLDDEYAEKSRFNKRVCHGMLVSSYISTVIGTIMPGQGSVYLDQECKFLKPVYIGDTINVVVEIIDIVDKGDKQIVHMSTDIYNQSVEQVVRGFATAMI